MLLNRFLPLTSAAAPVQTDSELIPTELFLLLNALRVRAEKGNVFESMVMNYVDNIIEYIKKTLGGSDIEEVKIHSAPSDKPTKEEVDIVFKSLLKSVPELENMSAVIGGMGLPERISKMIISYVDDIGTLKKWILNHMDKHSWEDFKAACLLIEEVKSLPNIDRIVRDGSPWNKFAKAILGCPDVKISSTNRFLLSSGLGLGNVVELWKQAQKERADKAAKIAATHSISEYSLDSLNRVCPLVEASVSPDIDISGVVSIESAIYVVDSKLGIFHSSENDVTDTVKQYLDLSTGTLYLSQVSYSIKFLQGKKSLKIKYRTVPKYLDNTEASIRQFTESLAEQGLIDGSCRSQNGPFTWYKLPEWLQVEIVQLFGNTMSHTPWYRFPFMEILKVYNDVLMKEYSIVAEKFGKQNALFNSAFVTDAVPMVVMGFLFAQMTLLAYPVKLIGGEDYNEDALVEQLVLVVPFNMKWEPYEKYIVGSPRSLTTGVWVVCVRTFKPLTEFLIKLANNVQTSVILQISNQSTVQMKVEITNPSKKVTLENIPGCKCVFDFQLPKVGKEEYPIQVSLEVQIPCLLSTIRSCISAKINIVQVYDFYG